MRISDSESIEQLQRKMKKLDLFLIGNVNHEVLLELNGFNSRAFFAHQLHEIFVKTAGSVNDIWQLNLDLKQKADAEDILDFVLAELAKKLKDQPPAAAAEAFRCIEDIITLESKMVHALADDIKKTIKAEQRAEFYRNLIKPFNDIWVFIRDTIQNLVTSMILFFQVRGGVEFQNIKQSSHLPFVHKSVTRSLDLLDARNPKLTDADEVKAFEKAIAKEITEHIKKMDLPAKTKDYAFNTLLRAKVDKAIEPYSGRTIMATLVTMWIAAQDSAVYAIEDSEQDINDRKNLIITHMALADREYNMDENGVDLEGPSSPACLGGTVNKITESLEIIHPDVRIIRGPTILADFSQEMFEHEFRKMNDDEQVLICAEKKGYDILRQKIGLNILAELKNINETIFDGELSDAKLNEYIENIAYLNIPETEAVLRYRNQCVNDAPSQEPPKQEENTTLDIIVDGYEVSKEEFARFNVAFDQMKKLLKGMSDIMIAKRCVKSTFGEELWDKNDNLQELADRLLAHKNQISVNKPATLIADQNDIDNNNDDEKSDRYMQGMR